MSEENVPRPPDAPEIERNVRLSPLQWIGLPLLIGLVVLALVGVFGEGFGRSRSDSGAIRLDVHYPARYRYKQIQTMTVTVENHSSDPIDTLTVVFDTTYMRGFSTVRFLPPADAVFEVPLLEVGPSERREVEVEIQGERYGRHRGTILAAGAGDTARVEVETLIYP